MGKKKLNQSQKERKKERKKELQTHNAATAAPEAPSKALAKPYFAGIDIIKILALLFVVGIHTFLYNGFYSASIDKEDYMLPIAFRWIFYTCVPLFMISTGYLMKNKKISGKYYLGLIRIIVVYIAVSIPCMRANKHYFNTEFTPWKTLKGFLEYSNASYGWYVNFYIALFLLIPFLNAAFNGLETRNQRLVLVITVAALTVFAKSLYIGSVREEQIRVLPDYLAGVYPLAYYFVGAYIREYPPKRSIRNKLIALIILGATLAYLTVSTYNQSYENTENNRIMLSWHFNDYGSYPVFIIATCIFVLLFDITTKNKVVKFILRQLSGVTLGAYLISYIFDRKFYEFGEGKYLTKYAVDFGAGETWNFDRFYHVYEPLCYVFFHALFWGLVIHNAYNLIEFLVKLAVKKITQPEEAAVKE